MSATELLVVGLGPAGGCAAAAAAEAGLNVLAIDRKRRLGEPVQCAELLPAPLCGEARATGALVQRVRHMRTWLPSHASHEASFPGVMIDRARFDRALAERARDVGARIRPASSLVHLDVATRTAVIRSGGRRECVRFELLVAADGPASPIARLMGLPRLTIVHARQWSVSLPVPRAHTEIWLSPGYPGGYAWLFPKGACANLGVGLEAARAAARRLAGLHRSLVQSGRVGRDIGARTGGAIPVGGIRRRLVHGRVMFAGDAAGLTNPVSGAGIHAAVVSGGLAGSAAAAYLGGEGLSALRGYEEETRELFGPGIARALRRRMALQAAAPGAADADWRRGWIGFEEYYTA